MLDSANGTTVIAGEARIPALGCGTWQLRGELCGKIVAEALRLGFRHVDTAQGYANEAAVGDGIAASGVPRAEIFVRTFSTGSRRSLSSCRRWQSGAPILCRWRNTFWRACQLRWKCQVRA